MLKLNRICAAALAAVAIAPGMVSAQSPNSDEWKFNAIIYAWLPSIAGKTAFPAGGSDINVNADKLIDDLKFAFSGTIAAQKGPWGIFADVVYADVGGSKSASRDLTVPGVGLPANISSDTTLDLKSTVLTLAASYRVAADPESTMDIFAGARAIKLKERLRWQFSANIDGASPPARSDESEITDKIADAIIGVKGRYAFGDNRQWFVPYYGDVGGGNSKLTWQGLVGIGYKFRWGDVFGAWRYLGYEFKGSRIEDLNLSGPAIAVAFRW